MRLKDDLYRFIRFCLVGISNTLVSLVAIYSLMYLGVNYKLANLVGYIIGLINSYIWNRRWVFNSKNKRVIKEALAFLGVFIFSYGLQYLSLIFLVQHQEINRYLAQLVSMVMYTVLSFMLNKYLTFSENAEAASDSKS